MLAMSVQLNFSTFLAVLSLLCCPQWSPSISVLFDMSQCYLKVILKSVHTHIHTHSWPTFGVIKDVTSLSGGPLLPSVP